MAYRIITDSCSDLPEALCRELDLTVVPMSITYRNESVNQFTPERVKDIYDALRAGEVITTSAVNPATWADYIEPFLAQGEDVLVMAFSSGLSTTYQSAVIAADELMEKYPERKVMVLDTLSASLGQGMYAYYACKMRDSGMSLEELYQWCVDNRQNMIHWFTVNDLMFLKRGGRVSAATALVGTMLQIKPVLHVDEEGHLIKVTTSRGRKGSLDTLVKKLQDTGLPGANDVVFLSHGDCLEDAEYVANAVKEKCGVKEVVIGTIGPVVGSHAGPGTVAFFFLGSQR